MSDADNEKPFVSEDDLEATESFTCVPMVKNRMSRKRRKDLSELRQPRQKFCARWENDFPWLKADKIDESVGICTVCKKHLVCKKSHLERHQKSFKHQILSGNRIEDEDDQPTAPEFLECGKREPDDEDNELENAIEIDPEYSEDFESNPIKRPRRNQTQKFNNSVRRSAKSAVFKSEVVRTPSSKLDRIKLLKRIDRDRQELHDYFYVHRNDGTPISTSPPAQQRDSFDLFFESVSASVKTLPPKLAAEVKSRVSQVIAEFELRAICEREALEYSANSSSESVVVATSTREIKADTSRDSIDAALPHIVYTFQPK